jgi:hypothetical protein
MEALAWILSFAVLCGIAAIFAWWAHRRDRAEMSGGFDTAQRAIEDGAETQGRGGPGPWIRRFLARWF